MNLKELFNKIEDCEYFENTNLTNYTTMRLVSVGDLLVVKSIKALQLALPVIVNSQKSYLVIGWGANQILPPTCDKVVIHLDFFFDLKYFDILRDEYILPASLGLNHLTSHAVKFGIKGWEVFTGIPASLGGAVYMNAGTNLGEIGPVVKSVDIVSKLGVMRTEMMNSHSFSYRKNHFLKDGDVIVSVTLAPHGTDTTLPQKIKDYLEFRKTSQPLATRNCGCVFKNPNKHFPAGKLIDNLGLKNLRLGGLRVSSKHGNFIENLGSSNWDHFQAITSLIKSNIDSFYGIEFELEVKIPYD